jgi:hypothetical protein
MYERGKSDRPVVPANLSNKAVEAVAEAGEGRRRAKGNTDSKTHPGHSAGTGASSALGRVREVARRDKEARFTALLHHVSTGRPAPTTSASRYSIQTSAAYPFHNGDASPPLPPTGKSPPSINHLLLLGLPRWAGRTRRTPPCARMSTVPNRKAEPPAVIPRPIAGHIRQPAHWEAER